MGRRKKGSPVHGWVILDKPQGMTSTQAVAAVRRIFDAQKAGHAGTLDPLATGILAVALGEATETVPYVQDAQKEYRFTARWGEARDSDDAEGKVTGTSPMRPSRDEIEALLPRFTGTLTQVPPAYSAIKVQGERAYDLARDGEVVTLEPRTVQVAEAKLLGVPDPDHAEFEIRCGKGTYVRAIARDLGRQLGCLGHIAALRRTRVGPFAEAEAVTLEPRQVQVYAARLIAMPDADHAEFEMCCGKGTYIRSWVRDLALALGTLGHVSALRRTRIGGFCEKDSTPLETLTPFMHSPAAFAYLKPLSTALDGIPALAVSGPDTVRLRSGNPILIRANLFARMKDGIAGDDGLQGLTVFLKDEAGGPVALAEIAEGELRPFRVFNFQGPDDR